MTENKRCSCGREHTSSVGTVISEPGALRRLPETVREYGGERVFILEDENTYKAAGEIAEKLLNESGIATARYVFSESPKPNEYYVGKAFMHYDYSCDIILAVGSGVIGDISKIIAKTTGHKMITVATAPSMDGYASATSAMERDGLKISMPTVTPVAIIGDTDILKNAPKEMLASGVGDMLAKYVSICEWRISHLINGEYYCDDIADCVRQALKKCVDNTEGLIRRDTKAVKAVFDGLVLSGMAMEYAGLSRPASGVEHYFSHIWDMRSLEFGTPSSLHGIQCAVGTLYATRIYRNTVLNTVPDREKAVCYVRGFNTDCWNGKLREFIGTGAEAMIEAEKNDGKYSPEKHADRIDIIIGNFEEIKKIIREELPEEGELLRVMRSLSLPENTDEIGIDGRLDMLTLKAAKDIRDKYVLPRLLWDLGIIDEVRAFNRTEGENE